MFTISRGARASALATALSASLLAAAPTAVAATAEVPAQELAGLRVLLTNDDSAQGRDLVLGTDGKGMYEVRKALCAAGADVVVVAPWGQQSGASARMATPGFRPVPLTVQRVSPPVPYAGDCAGRPSDGRVFGVCASAGPCDATSPSASPADAVNVALLRFAETFWAGGPDVVVAGSNFGQNVGSVVNHSGTVGAVVTAQEHRVPAVAFSTEVPRDVSQIPTMPFAETGAFAADLMSALRGSGALEPGLALNVNHPFVGPAENLGRPVSAVIGTADVIGMSFQGVGTRDGGTYQLVVGQPTQETRRNADTSALARNDIPITTLDGDWSTSWFGDRDGRRQAGRVAEMVGGTR